MKRRFPCLPLAAAVGLAALILARTDDPIPPAGNPDWAGPGAFSRIRSDRPDLEPLFDLIRSTLRANQARFITPSGSVRGFAAGIFLVLLDRRRLLAFPDHFFLGLSIVLLLFFQRRLGLRILGRDSVYRNPHFLLGLLILAVYVAQISIGLSLLL